MAKLQRVRMGMVGGGEGAFIGAVHRHAAGLDGQYDLVCGAFSRDTGNNQRTGDSLGLSSDRVYASWQEMLEAENKLPADERMEVVVVVTPNHLHVPVTIAALEAGYHVFCEKPAGLNLAETKELAKVVNSSDRLYGLAHTYLGYPMVWQAKAMVEDGKLGNIRKILVEYPQGWLSGEDDPDNKQAAWRTDPALSGGAGCMGDIGTHAFGLAEFISGHTVTELCADMNIIVPNRRLDDDGAAFFRTAEGAKGVLIASQVCAGEENALKIKVYGDKGGLEWHQMEPNSVIFRTLDAPYCVYRAGSGQPGLYPEASDRCRTPSGHREGYLEAFANLYRYFAIAVREGQTGKAEGVPGLKSGLRGMAFIEAMVASGASDVKWHPIPDTE